MDTMNRLDRLTQTFREQYDAFVKDCEAAEKEGSWDTKNDGSLEGYAFGALTGAILSLIVADGNVGQQETEYLNQNFGFAYTQDDLLELYRYSAKDLRENAVPNLQDAAERIGHADPALAASFRGLTLLACKILSESDDGVLESEGTLIRELEEAMTGV